MNATIGSAAAAALTAFSLVAPLQAKTINFAAGPAYDLAEQVNLTDPRPSIALEALPVREDLLALDLLRFPWGSGSAQHRKLVVA